VNQILVCDTCKYRFRCWTVNANYCPLTKLESFRGKWFNEVVPYLRQMELDEIILLKDMGLIDIIVDGRNA